MEPAQERSRIGKADLDKARALLSRARKDIEPRQWEQLDRKLTAAERAFERFSRAVRTSRQAAEVARGAEGLAQAGRASEAPLALSRVAPVLVALVLLWPSSTAGPESDSRPPWVDAQRELEARLRDVSETSRQFMAELEAPALRFPDSIRAPEIPHRLGWLNYWSAAAAHAIGFPDPARDAELLSRARRTETGGWVVRLTDAPLDLDKPAHLDALKRAYARFPEIGGRSTP